jgi:hypothetical protein
MSYLCSTRIIWLFKSLFDQNSIMINYKFNDDFNSYIILSMTQVSILELLVQPELVGH